MARRTPEPWYHPPADEVCALCGRLVPPAERDLHHMVPKSQGGRQTAVLHRICHRQLHALFTEKELAQRYSSVEALLAHEAVRGFVEWVKTKPDSFYQRTRRSRSR
ncbi:HNH endonuclease [Caballeronia sp. LZ065]|uniref:HNH endonuclease n=1 Tax=Caballeronia sp. LZ065 TaxID=3038571 RepID=UPI0028558A7C|nr:HNH endonuclease [Caballeronia sp. LZ065]MDR5782874.1 HNH endonuclease [Caballeronia sp. LZ065]